MKTAAVVVFGVVVAWVVQAAAGWLWLVCDRGWVIGGPL